MLYSLFNRPDEEKKDIRDNYEHPLLSKEKIDNFLITSAKESSHYENFLISPVSVSFNTSVTQNIPFFGSKLRQDMSGTNMPNDFKKSSTNHVSRMTGMNDFNFNHKQDGPKKFFKTLESKESKILTSSGKAAESTALMNVDRDRFRMDLKLKDDCFPRTQVGPSINTDASVPASGGFQSFYRHVDHERSRNYTYGVHMLGPLIEMKLPVFPKNKLLNINDEPHLNSLSTKPRIFDGDKEYSRSLKPPAMKQQQNIIVPKDDRFVQKEKASLEKQLVSSSFVTPRLYSQPNQPIKHEHFTNELETNPIINIRTEEHPVSYIFPSHTKQSSKREVVQVFNSQQTFPVASAQDRSAITTKVKERKSGTSFFTLPIYSNDTIELNTFHSFPKRNNNEYKNQFKRPYIVSGLSIHPSYSNNNNNEKKEIEFQNTKVRNKSVKFEGSSNFLNNNITKANREFKNTTFNHHIQRPNSMFCLNSYNNDQEFDDIKEKYPELLLPKTNNVDEIKNMYDDLKKTKRSTECGGSMFELPLFNNNTNNQHLPYEIEKSSLKKEVHELPQASGPYNSNINNQNNTDIIVRSSIKITDEEIKNKPVSIPRSFSNDLIEISTKKNMINDLYRPNSGLKYNTSSNISQSITTTKQDLNLFSRLPVPYNSQSASIKHIGINSNERI